jgi:hypothetical protein
VEAVEGEGEERLFSGKVDNQLLFTEDHGLSLHDPIQVRGKHIYQIHG